MGFMERCSVPCCICSFCEECKASGEKGGLLLSSMAQIIIRLNHGGLFVEPDYMKEILLNIYGFDYDKYIERFGRIKDTKSYSYWEGYEDAIKVLTGRKDINRPVYYEDFKQLMEEIKTV